MKIIGHTPCADIRMCLPADATRHTLDDKETKQQQGVQKRSKDRGQSEPGRSDGGRGNLGPLSAALVRVSTA